MDDHVLNGGVRTIWPRKDSARRLIPKEVELGEASIVPARELTDECGLPYLTSTLYEQGFLVRVKVPSSNES